MYLNFLIDKFVETGHKWNYLNLIVKGNKHQAPKTENTQQIIKLPKDTNYRTQNKKRTSKDMMQGHLYISYETTEYIILQQK